MKKPRLSERTIRRLYDTGEATSGKYKYEITRKWDEDLNTFVDRLTRWDENLNYEEWEIPAAEGIWGFEK